LFFVPAVPLVLPVGGFLTVCSWLGQAEVVVVRSKRNWQFRAAGRSLNPSQPLKHACRRQKGLRAVRKDSGRVVTCLLLALLLLPFPGTPLVCRPTASSGGGRHVAETSSCDEKSPLGAAPRGLMLLGAAGWVVGCEDEWQAAWTAGERTQQDRQHNRQSSNPAQPPEQQHDRRACPGQQARAGGLSSPRFFRPRP